MKDCGGKYLIWGIHLQNIHDDAPELIPNPLCISCEYTRVCAFRVAYFLEYGKDMPEEDIEIIKNLTDGPMIQSEQSSEKAPLMH